MEKLSVIDFFCGAGGFSEGFRQQGFDIKMGIDSWQPAIDTFNHNFGLNCIPKNILDFEHSIKEIEDLPDTDVIIGSPPCVSFSHSNISGKADKQSGILLTKVLLRIIAVKKFQKNTKLKAWFMENVSNSKNYLNDYYTLKDLGLSDWAKKNQLNPNKKAIVLKYNQPIINSADYGSPQKRKRVISGEIISKGTLIVPQPTHKDPKEEGEKEDYLTLSLLRSKLPKPNSPKTYRLVCDPLYPMIKIKSTELSDQFYDTGLFSCEWRQSLFLKINHPYMGTMSFPENENNPSRTITATKIGTSREAIIYKSEFNRIGDGQYRTPTVREAACLMGFPITFQFKGSEGTKWRLVGNAVCPSVSRLFAKQLRFELGMKNINSPIVQSSVDLNGINNLNSYSQKEFVNPPKRTHNSRFRRHPFKAGNITVTLSNYDIENNEKQISKWITSVQYGNGKGFPIHMFADDIHIELEQIIRKLEKGVKFIGIINNGYLNKIGKANTLQLMFENQKSRGKFQEPTKLIEDLAKIIDELDIDHLEFLQNESVIFKNKAKVPLKQLFALYGINKISSIANSK